MKKLLIAAMFSSLEALDETTSDLKERYGEITAESDTYDFNFTKYYEKEMGPNLKKKIIVFEKDIEKKDLAEIRLIASEIEQKYSVNGKRSINLDPGYIGDREIVLASFKKGTNFKEQISDKVWAHKVLEFKDGKAITFWHTFADYRADTIKEFFFKILDK